MATVVPDPARIHSFESEAAFEAWLAAHHDREPEIWIKIHKNASGLASITPAEALDVALCWGWIDAIRKGLDERSYLQRYVPRGRKSRWSQINCGHVARLTAAGRMTPHGRAQVDAAKADGRWDAAYAPMSAMDASAIPADLGAAIAANPRARKVFATLNKQNLFALAFRTNAMKTAAGRERKIAALVAMLARGETILPNPPPRPKVTAAAGKPPRRGARQTKKE